MSEKTKDQVEGEQEETTNWGAWYILLVTVLVAEIVIFWLITNSFGG